MNEGATRASGPETLRPRFHEAVVAGGRFTQDWFTSRIAGLEPALAPLAGRSARILEIGAFEGLSACYFLWRLPDATITCIDTFEGSPGLPSGEAVAIEAAFDHNVALVDAGRVRKLVGRSHGLLLGLADGAEHFDLVYVDGSHLGLDVLVDAVLSWRLVEPGGVVVFDDYRWALLGDDVLLRPGAAIDAFVSLVSEHAEVLFRDDQVAIRRLS